MTNTMSKPTWVYAVRMTGRCANGAERDGGKLVHIVDLPEGVKPAWQPAICGKAPGRKGNGWSEHLNAIDDVSCPRCRKRLESLE